MENYEVVYDTICRLGGARLDRLIAECKLSQSTASRAIKELDTDYMIWREKNICGQMAPGRQTRSFRHGSLRTWNA